MKKRMLLQGRIYAIPAALILILLILVQSQGADGMVVLPDEEASSITGSDCIEWCLLDGDGCYESLEDCPTGTAGSHLPDCQTPCENAYHAYACKDNVNMHAGCETLDDRDCGDREEGTCDGSQTSCQIDTYNVSCGDASYCQNL